MKDKQGPSKFFFRGPRRSLDGDICSGGACGTRGVGETLPKPGECVITDPITFKGKAVNVKSEGGADATMIRRSEKPADPERASAAIFENGE